MIEEIKSFLNKCDGNEELTEFAEGLFECWMHGCNAMHWRIEDDKNILTIKNFFKAIYGEYENFYSIKKWEPSWEPSYNRKEYEIKWYFNLEDIPTLEENE